MAFITSGQAQTYDPTAINDLAFDNVYPGVPKTVTKYTAGKAAEFHVDGTAGDDIQIDFTLPTYLAASGFNMPIIFVETDLSMDSSATPDQSSPGYDNRSPWQSQSYQIGSSGLQIWLGATLVPKLGQPPGSYSGMIVLTCIDPNL